MHSASLPGLVTQPYFEDFSGLTGVVMTDLVDADEQAEHKRNCLQLRQAIRQANRNVNDQTLQDLLQRRHFSMPSALRPPKSHSDTALLAFFQLTFWGMDARGVHAWMIDAKWDFQTAVEEYMSHRFQTDGAPGSGRGANIHESGQMSSPKQLREASISGDQSSSADTEVSEAYVDEDPDNVGRNIPDNLVVEEYRDPETDEAEPCVRHEQIRQYLIDQAAMSGQYRYARESGPETDDRTSFLNAQRNWGFAEDDRSQYPPILFILRRGDRLDPHYPDDQIPPMRWRGLLVIDHNGAPVRRFRNIPATLSSSMEGGLIEAIFREDSRIETYDLLARMPHQYPQDLVDGTVKWIAMRPNTLTVRCSRFREKAACYHWYGRKMAVRPYDSCLLNSLPDALQDANNTCGLVRNLNEREVNLMKGSNRLTQPPVIEFALIEEFPVAGGDKMKSAYHPDKEHDCRDCTPPDLIEQAALNDAMLITVLNFIELTGMCPRLPLRRMSYHDLFGVVAEQLSRHYAGMGRLRPRLKKIGRWTGGIKRWRSGAVMDG